ncbi:MAG: hypothetical protein ACYT04_17280 [Nostoc sp.]
MEILKLTTKIDESGYLNLNIPTQLASGDVNVVVLNPVFSDRKQQASYDFSDLVGRLIWGERLIIIGHWALGTCMY